MPISVDLAVAVNKMYRTVSGNGERTAAEVATVADSCAKAAEQAGSDTHFRQGVREASRLQTIHVEEVAFVLGPTDESKARLNEFFEKERGLLRGAGLEYELVEASLARGSELADRAHEWRGDSEQFLGTVDQLRDGARDLHRRLTAISNIEKALAQASALADSLKRDLEWARADNSVEQQALRRNQERSQLLTSQISNARQTNRELTDQLTRSGQSEESHQVRSRAWSIASDLMFAAVGLAIVFANVTMLQAVSPADSAVSCTLGGAFTGTGIEALRHSLFGDR